MICSGGINVRIIVMSDSHGNYGALEKIVELNLGHADMFIHLGDGENETDRLRMKYPHLDIRSVAGNCDYASLLPDYMVVSANGTRIFCAHGHRCYVKSGLELIRSLARDNRCKVVLFGHTHERYLSYEDGIYIMNPGSCSCPRDGRSPSFGSIDITPKGILTNIADLY